MRTTLTLDDDVAALLRRVREQRQVTWKTAVNDALRRGLVSVDDDPVRGERYRVTPLSLGEPRLASFDSVSDVLAVAEGEDFG
jgi:hypothetical protein